MPSMLNRIISGALWVASMPAIAMAHPGHGHADPDSPAHYLLSFEHLAPAVAVCLIALAIALRVRSRRLRPRAS